MIVLKIPLLDSLAGIGFSLNHRPLAYIKKSWPGFAVESMLDASASVISSPFGGWHELKIMATKQGSANFSLFIERLQCLKKSNPSKRELG
jgi:hypothetical protein